MPASSSARSFPRHAVDVKVTIFSIEGDKFIMRSFSPCRLFMPPHLNELGMGAEGKGTEGLSHWRVVALHAGVAYQWQRWQRKTTTARVRVKHRIAAMMEWENNSCRYFICSHESSTGRGVIEFKVHWYVGGGNILHFLLEIIAPCLLACFTFPLFTLSLCLREMTPWGHFLFDTMKKTQLEPLRTWWRSPDAVLFSLPGALVHCITL